MKERRKDGAWHSVPSPMATRAVSCVCGARQVRSTEEEKEKEKEGEREAKNHRCQVVAGVYQLVHHQESSGSFHSSFLPANNKGQRLESV